MEFETTLIHEKSTAFYEVGVSWNSLSISKKEKFFIELWRMVNPSENELEINCTKNPYFMYKMKKFNELPEYLQLKLILANKSNEFLISKLRDAEKDITKGTKK